MINIYCDESCHLELSHKSYDMQKSMVIGGIACDKDYVKEVSEKIKLLKEKHEIYKYNEIKWTKISEKKLDFYKELIQLFFSDDNLSFRCVVFPDKKNLDYSKYDHEDIYNIMYYYLLRNMINNQDIYDIYVDKKDTHGSTKFKSLQTYLCRTHHDFDMKRIKKIQIVDSRDLQLIQLADILIGAISYYHRGFVEDENKSNAKKEIVRLIQDLSKVNLKRGNSKYSKKFNVFVWKVDGKQ